ncbi:MAG: aldo/keto reductase [Sphingorhabdus sp.]|nr:aldo/keto reductase [Sphingorhabdus sp.]
MSIISQTEKFRTLGNSDLKISSLAWGMWRFAGDVGPAAKLIHTILDCGINFFDTADIYGFNGASGFGDAEALLGKLLAAEPGLRTKMILASKGGIMPPLPYDSSAAYLTSAIDASLARLNVDYLDLWYIHRPDILTHPQEIARTLGDAVAAGKIRAVGVSNHTIAQINALQSFLDIPIAATQPELSPFCLSTIENGELDQAMQMNMAVFAWSPLGGGRISDPQTPREMAVVAALDIVAQQQNVSRAAAAYSWIMAHPARPIPIIGSQNEDRIKDAAGAYKVEWTRDSWYDILVASRGEQLP